MGVDGELGMDRLEEIRTEVADARQEWQESAEYTHGVTLGDIEYMMARVDELERENERLRRAIPHKPQAISTQPEVPKGFRITGENHE